MFVDWKMSNNIFTAFPKPVLIILSCCRLAFPEPIHEFMEGMGLITKLGIKLGKTTLALDTDDWQCCELHPQ
jgi:hypothetical protein